MSILTAVSEIVGARQGNKFARKILGALQKDGINSATQKAYIDELIILHKQELSAKMQKSLTLAEKTEGIGNIFSAEMPNLPGNLDDIVNGLGFAANGVANLHKQLAYSMGAHFSSFEQKLLEHYNNLGVTIRLKMGSPSDRFVFSKNVEENAKKTYDEYKKSGFLIPGLA